MRLKRENCAAVLIDIQSKLFPHIHEHKILEDKVSRLLRGLQVLDVPLLVTQQYSRGIGETIDSLKNIIGDGFKHIEKSEFSCMDNVDFQAEFMGLGRDQLIIFGIESHVCVLQTVIDTVNMGYTAVLVEDCISSRNIKDKKTALMRAAKEGAIITSYEALLF